MIPQRILIVDDRPTNRDIFAKVAGSIAKDVAVETFGDPRDALDWLRDNSADLIIVDYRMPNLTGAEFTEEVRRRPNVADVPIIVITAYNDREYRLRALDAGATDFLQSPVDHREFQSRARNLLERRSRQLSVEKRTSALERQLESTHGAGMLQALPDAALLRQLVDMVPIMISAVDRDGHCLFANAQLAAILDRKPADLVGKDLTDIFGPERSQRDRQRDAIIIDSGRSLPAYEEAIDHNGINLVCLTSKSPLRSADGEIIGVLTSSVDISGRKLAEDHLRHIARHDMLTGLPNRIMLRDQLQRMIDQARRGNKLVAVSLLDLDRFKTINDTRGHQTGDLLLQEVAKRIDRLLGPGDFAARLGGDEFAILQSDCGNADEIGVCNEELLDLLNQPYDIDDATLVLSASMGIAISPRDSIEPDELLRMADLAMYEAKACGRNAIRFYSGDLDKRAQTAAALETDLRAAIIGRQFYLDYQPIVDARTGTIVAAEALIRWDHPAHGRLAPDQFFEAAAEIGLMAPMGVWVLQEACSRFVEWRKAGASIDRIAVNLAPIQFQRQDVFMLISDVIRRTGIAPQSLELEITEATLLNDHAQVAATLARLRALGVSIAIDDFGTGYSSLQYLRDLPADRLKIDRVFVNGIDRSSTDAAIVTAINHLASAIGLHVVAEGVESGIQASMLRAIGCQELQGFFIGRPQPAEALLAMLGVAAGDAGLSRHRVQS